MLPHSTSHVVSAASATTSQVPSVPPRKHSRTAQTTAPYQRSPSSSDSPSASGSPSSTSAGSPASSHTPPSNAVRWPCRLPGCTKSYTRPYDLIRHIVSAHHSSVASASDEDIMGAGVPSDLVYRVHELLERTNRCARCGKAFSRRDALVRHEIEQKHGSPAPPPPPPPPGEFLDPMIPVDEFLSRLGLGPAVSTPALRVSVDLGLDLFDTPSSILADQDTWPLPLELAPALALPSLDDWETLIATWAASHEA